MKAFVYILLVFGILIGCNSPKTIISTKPTEVKNNVVANDTVKIENDDLGYEITIIEPGFNFWLASTAMPEGYYSQGYLENKNLFYVTEWNNRVTQPQRYNPDLYEMQINYQQGIDYGYDVNYKLYNYFVYFQLKYKQQLLPGVVPRI